MAKALPSQSEPRRDEMDRAYRADQAAQRAFDDLCQRIEAFLTDAPDRTSVGTREALVLAAGRLRVESDGVVATWN
jgi:hypothetical protein